MARSSVDEAHELASRTSGIVDRGTPVALLQSRASCTTSETRSGTIDSPPACPSAAPRSNISVAIATDQPSPSRPGCSQPGMRASSKCVSLKPYSPVIFLIGFFSTPGMSTGARKKVRPLYLLGASGMGAGEQDHVLGLGAEAGPDLGPVEHPLVAVAHRRRLCVAQVAAVAGLAEALAPDLLAAEDLLDVAQLLLVRCRAAGSPGRPTSGR